MSPFHRPFSGQKGISKVKRNERMGKSPNQNRILTKKFLTSTSTTHAINSRPLPAHPLISLSRSSFFSNARHAGRRRTSRINLHPHPRAHLLLNLQLPPSPFPPGVGLKTSPSSTQSWPCLAARSFRNAHADGHRALAFPRFALVRQTASSLC